VHNGTAGGSGGYIYPDRANGYMVLYSRPDNPAGAFAAGYGSYYRAPAWQVHGQDANPFLAQALVEWCLENGFKRPALNAMTDTFA